MGTRVVNATYDHGVFRLESAQTLGFQNGQKVQLTVQPIEQVDAILELAAEVYAGLNEEEIAAIEELTKRNDDFFGKKMAQ